MAEEKPWMAELTDKLNELCTCGHSYGGHANGGSCGSHSSWMYPDIRYCNCQVFTVAPDQRPASERVAEFMKLAEKTLPGYAKSIGVPDPVNHPAHYGGEDNPYEAIKVIEAWGLASNFYSGNAVKYIARAGKKGSRLEDLKKAQWYLAREIAELERGS